MYLFYEKENPTHCFAQSALCFSHSITRFWFSWMRCATCAFSCSSLVWAVAIAVLLVCNSSLNKKTSCSWLSLSCLFTDCDSSSCFCFSCRSSSPFIRASASWCCRLSFSLRSCWRQNNHYIINPQTSCLQEIISNNTLVVLCGMFIEIYIFPPWKVVGNSSKGGVSLFIKPIRNFFSGSMKAFFFNETLLIFTQNYKRTQKQ